MRRRHSNQTSLSPDFIDISIEFEFSINESLSSSSVSRIELLSIPSINFTIHFRKQCTESVIVRQLAAAATGQRTSSNNSRNSKSNFTIAYLIMIILVASVIVMGVGYIYYTAENRRRRQLLGGGGGGAASAYHMESAAAAAAKSVGMTKYESFTGAAKSSRSGPAKIYHEDPYQHRHQHNHPSLHPHRSTTTTTAAEVVTTERRQVGMSTYAEHPVPRRPRSRSIRTEANQMNHQNNSSSNIYETGMGVELNG